MALKRQLERLYEWACNKSNYCDTCKYAVDCGWDDYTDEEMYVCPFENVIRAAEDRAKEGKKND